MIHALVPSMTTLFSCVSVNVEAAQTTGTPPAWSALYAAVLVPAFMGNVLLRVTFTSRPALFCAMSALMKRLSFRRYMVMWTDFFAAWIAVSSAWALSVGSTTMVTVSGPWIGAPSGPIGLPLLVPPSAPGSPPLLAPASSSGGGAVTSPAGVAAVLPHAAAPSANSESRTTPGTMNEREREARFMKTPVRTTRSTLAHVECA